MESSEHHEGPEGQEQVQRVRNWARAWTALRQALGRFPHRSRPAKETPPPDVVGRDELTGVRRMTKALVVGLTALLATYGGAVIIALGMAPFDVGRSAEIIAVTAVAGGVLLVTSSWLASAPGVTGVLRRASTLLLTEFVVLGAVGIIVGTAELVEAFT